MAEIAAPRKISAVAANGTTRTNRSVAPERCIASMTGKPPASHGALTRSALILADAGRVVSIVDIAQPQNLIEAWGKNAAYHFVFTRQNRGKLTALTNLVERGLIKPVIGAVLPLARIGEAHALLENGSSRGLRGKVAIDVAGQSVELPAER